MIFVKTDIRLRKESRARKTMWFEKKPDRDLAVFQKPKL